MPTSSLHRPRQRPRRNLRRTTATLAGAALVLALTPSSALATDTLPWTGESAKGANQPYQHGYSSTDLLAWTPQSDLFGDLLRARVPLQERVEPIAETQLHPDLSPSTQLLNLAGDYGNAFFESHQSTNEFSTHLFDFWQYTDIHASWHGQPVEGVPEELYDPTLDWREKWFEFGMLNLPNPAYTNAAHKNGVRSLGTIFFSENDRGTQTYTELLVQDEDGGYPLADKLVELAGYYGFDGYFINQEEPSVAVDDIVRYKEFLQALRDGGLYVQFYDSVHNTTGDRVYQNEFNALNSPFVRDPELGDVSDSMFLNYWWDAAKLTASRDHARLIGLDPHEAVFAGVEAGMYQFDQPYDLADNLDADGQPMNSIATLGADFVHSDMADKEDDAEQWRAFDRSRQWWTGSSTGRPGGTTSDGWDGVASYITERSAISGSTFSTTFNTGHGLEYRTAGDVSADREWSNINVQDVPVTWQWDVRSDGTPLEVDYDYGPDHTTAERFTYEQVGAYEGGSSLAVAGPVDADSTVRLYRTDLDVTDRSALEVTYTKPSASDGTELRMVVTLVDDPGTEIELPLPGSGERTAGWTTSTVDLSALAGERIATVGLKVAAAAEPVAGFQVNLGALRLTDGVTRAPAAPTGFSLDAALINTDELLLSWDLAPYEDVARYEVYLGDKYVGGTYDESLYVKKFAHDRGTLKLYAVGHDGARSAPARIAYDVTAAPSDVVATPADDGTLDVTWSAAPGAGPTLVELTSEYSDSVVERSAVAEPGGTSVTFTGLPVDGGHYRLSLRSGDGRGSGGGSGTAVATRAEFIDTVADAYPAELVTINGSRMRVRTPAVPDWDKLYVTEDGVAKTFATTYSSGEKPYVIRGRTTSLALTDVPVSSPDSEIAVTLEDYAGNRTTTVVRPAATAGS